MSRPLESVKCAWHCQSIHSVCRVNNVVIVVYREEEKKHPSDYAVVDVAESMWSLDDDDDAHGQPCKQLMINLVKPPLSEDEIMWKKGEGIVSTAD
jgi:hypothetical protein